MWENPADSVHIFSCDPAEGERWIEKILLARVSPFLLRITETRLIPILLVIRLAPRTHDTIPRRDPLIHRHTCRRPSLPLARPRSTASTTHRESHCAPDRHWSPSLAYHLWFPRRRTAAETKYGEPASRLWWGIEAWDGQSVDFDWRRWLRREWEWEWGWRGSALPRRSSRRTTHYVQLYAVR